MRPEDLKFAKTHEWVRSDGDIAEVGITDFAVEQLTDLTYVDLPEPGISVEQREEFGEIESVKAVSPLFAPVSGQIVEVHSELADEIEKISADPFGEGWMIRIRMEDPSELEDLLDAAGYERMVEEDDAH